jgi:hypothetical protein
MFHTTFTYDDTTTSIFSAATLTQLSYDTTKILTSVVIGENVTLLADNCFANCGSLSSIMIPYNVTCLGDFCFYNCSSLTSIKIPNSMTCFGDNCFNNCFSLNSITIPDNVISLGNYCFCNCCSLTSIIISKNVTSLGNYCFYGCFGLTHLTYANPSIISFAGSNLYDNTSIINVKFCNTLNAPSIGVYDRSLYTGCNSFQYFS